MAARSPMVAQRWSRNAAERNRGHAQVSTVALGRRGAEPLIEVSLIAGLFEPLGHARSCAGSGWVLSHSSRALTIGLIFTFSHHTGSSPQRWTSRW